MGVGSKLPCQRQNAKKIKMDYKTFKIKKAARAAAENCQADAEWDSARGQSVILKGRYRKSLSERSFLIYNIFSLGKLCCLKLCAAKRSLIMGKFRSEWRVGTGPHSPRPPRLKELRGALRKLQHLGYTQFSPQDRTAELICALKTKLVIR